METADILLRACERWPSHPAVVDGDRRRTYVEVARRAAALARSLADLGVERGDRMALSERNSSAFFECTWAAAQLGAILVPINTRLALPEQVALLEDSECVLWVASTDFETTVTRAASGATGPRRLVWIGAPADTGLPIPTSDYESLCAGSGATYAPAGLEEDAVAQLYYTSGTTGRPKGVMLTHGNLCAHALAATSELDLAEDDRWGHVAPMFHLVDAWATLAVTWVGACHVMAPRFEARSVLALMQREGVTITNLVPTMIQRLLLELERGAEPPSALRRLLSGGSPIAIETVRGVLARFGCEYVQTYGMTETSPFLTLSLLEHHHWELSEEQRLRVRARTGRPFEGVELEVVDESGSPVPADDASVGEIRVRGRTVSPGYWHDREATEAAHRDGWLYTGDLAVIDGEGYVDIVDRKQDVILTGGENVYSREVEDALCALPGVLEAAVFGVPDSEWGEAVAAAVVLEPGPAATEEELLGTCRERLAGYKCPRWIEVVEELPRTGSGKVRKAALRELAAGRRGTGPRLDPAPPSQAPTHPGA